MVVILPVDSLANSLVNSACVRQVGAALAVSAFVLAATVGGFHMGLLVMIAVSAGTFACILALPAHSLPEAQELDATE